MLYDKYQFWTAFANRSMMLCGLSVVHITRQQLAQNGPKICRQLPQQISGKPTCYQVETTAYDDKAAGAMYGGHE
jgi:hypothetical protein